MNCWVCGSEALSGEHIVKASDLRGYYGAINQSSPLYYSNSMRRNIPVGSVKSDRFKSKAKLCANCNNSLSQPYDMAWAKMSNFIRVNLPAIKESKRLNLAKVFPGNSAQEIVNVHLYFVKLFGCRIAEYNIPIPIENFSQSLINGTAHPDLYLVFETCEAAGKARYCGVSKITSSNANGRSIAASWVYSVGELSVKLIYSPIVKAGLGLQNRWHPNDKAKIIKFGAY